MNPALLRSGKVRDIYRWGEEIWLVASDRISAYDVILPNPNTADPFACKESGNLIAPTRGMRILSSSPTHPLAGLRLTGFGTLSVRLRRTRLPQFHRASPSTALDKKRADIILQNQPAVKLA